MSKVSDARKELGLPVHVPFLGYVVYSLQDNNYLSSYDLGDPFMFYGSSLENACFFKSYTKALLVSKEMLSLIDNECVIRTCFKKDSQYLVK